MINNKETTTATKKRNWQKFDKSNIVGRGG